MAGKHYVIATNDGYIVDTVTGYPEEFATKQDAIKALTEIVRDAAERCRRSYKTCSVVGTARDGDVQIRVGGRQGYHLWDRFLINERAGSRKPRKESAFMRELRGASTPSPPPTGHARKKSPVQLQREIDEVLAKPVNEQSKASEATHADRLWLADWAGKVAGRPLDAREVAVDAERTFDVLAHERPQVTPLRRAFVSAVMNHWESRKYQRYPKTW